MIYGGKCIPIIALLCLNSVILADFLVPETRQTVITIVVSVICTTKPSGDIRMLSLLFCQKEPGLSMCGW